MSQPEEDNKKAVRGVDEGEILELYEQYMMRCVHAWHDAVFVKGHGTKLWDSSGKEYLDCFAGVSVVNAGHCHPKIVAAVKAQLDQLTHLTSLFHTVPEAYLAKRISEMVLIKKKGGGANKVYFCNGSEANEVAITLAKKSSNVKSYTPPKSHLGCLTRGLLY